MNMSFYTAAVGAEQQQTRLDVLGNNIANVNNTGFCAKRPVFTALMYDFMDGVDGARLPRGSGAYMSSADSNFAAQAMPDTGRAQDYAIEGDGFLPCGIRRLRNIPILGTAHLWYQCLRCPWKRARSRSWTRMVMKFWKKQFGIYPMATVVLF